MHSLLAVSFFDVLCAFAGEKGKYSFELNRDTSLYWNTTAKYYASNYTEHKIENS